MKNSDMAKESTDKDKTKPTEAGRMMASPTGGADSNHGSSIPKPAVNDDSDTADEGNKLPLKPAESSHVAEE